MTRPEHLLVVTGTGTGVGKTWVAASLLRVALAAGWTVAARKPAQSFDPEDPSPLDAEVLGAASGEWADRVCPPHRCYERALAPVMAASELGRPAFTTADLVAELVWPSEPGPVRLGVVEGAGGVRSPLSDDGDTVALIEGLRPDGVVLVADAGLGTINDTVLAVGVISAPVTVFLNRFDPRDATHRLNERWLLERVGLRVVTTVTGLLPSS